jgi:DNA-directed RNA polymerase subunit alpha
VGGSRLTSEAAETPIENLDLSVRVFNSLKRTGITTVGDVLDLLEKGDEAVMSIRNFGEKSLDELRQKMQEKGFLQDEIIVE